MSKPIFKNIINYYTNSDSYITYFYLRNYPNTFDYDTNKYRNNYLFNFNHSRFYKDNIRLEFDPLIYINEEKKWPEYVKHIYYTNITYDNKLVQLSYITNLYLNLCFSKQDYCSLHRTGYYMIYDLIAINKEEIDTETFFNSYITQKQINFYNTDIFYKDTLHHMLNLDKKPLIKYAKEETQPTNWAYKNFFDYIPICYIPNEHLTLITSNICFHSSDCHDTLCKTHNHDNLYLSHLHYDLQSYYSKNSLEIINIHDLSKYLA